MTDENRIRKTDIKTEAKIRNNASSKKLADAFLSEDVANAKSYIFWDVVVPVVKDSISVTLHSAIDAVFGPSRRGYSSGGPANRTNYQKISSVRADSPKAMVNNRSYNLYTFDDILIKDRGVAQLIKDDLEELIEEYGNCSINDYFDTCMAYISDLRIDRGPQDASYGWVSLNSAKVEPAGGGYWYIRFPKARPIK